MSERIEKLIEEVKNLSVLELSELVKALEETFGVSAAAPMAVVAGNSGATDAPVAVEKSEFDIILSNIGENKMGVIKLVKEITGLSLKEAKDLVDNAPKTLKENASKSEAEEIQTKLKEVGATVELK